MDLHWVASGLVIRRCIVFLPQVASSVSNWRHICSGMLLTDYWCCAYLNLFSIGSIGQCRHMSPHLSAIQGDYRAEMNCSIRTKHGKPHTHRQNNDQTLHINMKSELIYQLTSNLQTTDLLFYHVSPSIGGAGQKLAGKICLLASPAVQNFGWSCQNIILWGK